MIVTLTAHVHTLYFMQLINDDYISVVRRLHSISNTHHLNEIKQPTQVMGVNLLLSVGLLIQLACYILTSFMSLYRFIFMKGSASLSKTAIILSTLYLSTFQSIHQMFMKPPTRCQTTLSLGEIRALWIKIVWVRC